MFCPKTSLFKPSFVGWNSLKSVVTFKNIAIMRLLLEKKATIKEYFYEEMTVYYKRFDLKSKKIFLENI